jgi:hypothetical protein
LSPCVRPCRRSSGPPGRYGAKQHYGFGPPRLLGVATAADVRSAPETSPFRQTGPSNRQARPPKGNGVREESPRESRPACARVLASSASAQFRYDSVVGPHRLGEVASYGVVSPVAGGESNPKPAGSGVCRSEAGRGRCPRRTPRTQCGRRGAPVRPRALPAGPEFREFARSHCRANRQFMRVPRCALESHVCDNSLSQ